jgi:hypothetical protein
MKKLFTAVGILILAIIALAALVGGYYGFVPGVSALFGSDTPRDLGVRHAAEDLKSAEAKSGIAFRYKPSTGSPEGSIAFDGSLRIDGSFTGAELTALLAADQWEYNFLEDTQIRINADGSEEVAGILVIDRIPGFLAARGYSAETIEKIGGMLKYIPTDPTFHVKLDAGWKDDVLDMRLQEASVGRLSASQGWLDENGSAITGAVQSHVLSAGETSIESLRFDGGSMEYHGTFPSSITWAK